ncbi:hypothetical protein [Microbacterium aerolatum]|uniref:Uncharacterized protein n=1 Tax=Microbacterium aerolatum TaxID=153731 RepID=A0A511A9T9_9MICO|nr:hypothetical protein [Microbacterium aerolatum]GEK84960.1 hypothetical protein MAE01_01360 [Microbacterium aerolatum]GGB37586.1 hypothetical protein GCM10007198_30170 [Microbacterium aerolatum]
MSDEQQPRPEWIFPEEKKSNKGRIWLIVGLSALALAIIGVLLFFLIPRDGEPAPTTSPSASATTTPTSTPSPTATATSAPTPTTEPAPTQPPVPDPDLDTFRGQVQPRLDDATRGLQLVKDNMDLGAQIVDSLQNDAAALSDTPAPSSISDDWSDAVSQYASKLGELRAAYDNGTDLQAPLDAAGSALQKVRALVGL